MVIAVCLVIFSRMLEHVECEQEKEIKKVLKVYVGICLTEVVVIAVIERIYMKSTNFVQLVIPLVFLRV